MEKKNFNNFLLHAIKFSSVYDDIKNIIFYCSFHLYYAYESCCKLCNYFCCPFALTLHKVFERFFFLIRGHDLTKLLFFFVRKVILKSIKRRGNENVKPQNKIIQVLKFPSAFLKFPTSKSKKDFYFVVSFKWSRNIAGKS